MNKMDIHSIIIDDKYVLTCIGSEKSICNLREIKHSGEVSKLVDFLIENNIYCNLSFDEGVECVFSDKELKRLMDVGLLVDGVLAVEAMFLTYKGDIYEKANVLGFNKEEVDDILNNSSWLEKFDF